MLTDDLALRRQIERNGGTAVGTIGPLVRAHNANLLTRQDLERVVEDLFARSTLHLSPPFRACVRRLLADLP